MRKTYKFEKAFGPVASYAGQFILFSGLIATYYGWTGLILVFFGAFLGFTNSSTTIDYNNKKARFTNNIFGIIKIGKWLHITDDMKIGARKSTRNYRAYSRSNRQLDLKIEDNKLYLFSANGKQIIPLKKINKKENIKHELTEMSKQLEIETI